MAATVLQQHGAYVLQHDSVEDCTRSVHVLVVSRYNVEPDHTQPTDHPYLSSLPRQLQKHFNPRKMDRDRYEEPYNTRAEEWFAAEAPCNRVEEVTRDMVPSCGTCYVLPLTTAPGRKDYEGLHVLSKKFYRKVASFLMDLGKKEVHLSFLGVGVGGLVAKASLPMLQREGSALHLSCIEVVLGSFVTLDTPHLGVRRPPELGNMFKWFRHWRVMAAQGMVGRELLMEDADFILMEMSMHDMEVARCMECFEQVVFACIRYNTECPASSGLMHTDPKMTPLGVHVHLCKRTVPDDDLVKLVTIPVVEWSGSALRSAPYAVVAEARYALLESMWGLPIALGGALLAASFQDDYMQPTVLGFDVLVVVQLVLSLLLLLTLGTAGYAFSAGIHDTPESRYAHLSDPLAVASYYKICTRVCKTSPTDHHSELCINTVKEVLNTRYYHEARRCLIPPHVSKREAFCRAVALLDLKGV